MQPWLIGQLIDRGILTPSGLSRKAKARECRKCRAWVLAGLDSHVAALEAHADPYPLTAFGEAEALLDGRVTYDLEETRLHRRLHWNIAGRPAGSRHLVVAEHRCGFAIRPSWQLPQVKKAAQEVNF